MCGIAGAYGITVPPAMAGELLDTMKRRGPDDSGVYIRADCSLLHSRLAIIDPTGGRQPMCCTMHGETYILVYNGELYNTRELYSSLCHLGHTFTGHSDTEVVLHAYIQWGPDCVNRFNGIFAFAVWEETSGKLFLARDRIGVKPLFYRNTQESLIFASEIKTILKFPGVRAELDREGALQLIMLGPGRLPGSGIFRGIRELEPGCCAVYQGGKLTVNRYWSLKDREHRDSFEDTAAIVRELTLDAIRRQMVSDVPIGTFLSGGLDSSLISAVCAEEMKKSGNALQTFSVDYADNDLYFIPSKFQPNSDGYYIRLMSDAIQSDHRTTILSPEQLVEALEEATIARDLPGMADVDASLLLFCREIRQNVKVALSGECADEIFGGYPWYRDPEIRSKEGFPWAQNLSFRKQLLHPDLAAGTAPEEFVMDAYRNTCTASDILPGISSEERRMKEMVNLNFRWFMQTLLDRKDRMSMYSGLEVRVPFCDYRIAEYLYSVPWAYKDWRGREKGLLRYAMKGILPDEVLYRKKSPYPKTFDPQYAKLVHSRLNDLLSQTDAPLFSLLNREIVAQITDWKQPWPWYGQLMQGPQTAAYLLQLDFWLRRYSVELVP